MPELEINYGEKIQKWGQDKARLREEPTELLYSLTTILNQLGLEIGLATICIRTPHPQLSMLVMRWRPLDVEEVPANNTTSILKQETIKRADGVLDIYPLLHGHTDEEMFQNSPFHRVIESRQSIRVPLEPPPSPVPFPILDDLIERHMTDYLVVPLDSGETVNIALSLTTLRKSGFPDAFIKSFNDFLPLLSLSVAFKVERIQFSQVLSAYIGHEPASLVLKGQIKRGNLVSQEAALGFIDLKGFTAASENLSQNQFLKLMDDFFEQVYEAVYQAGGEILKFIGDAVLFIVTNTENPEYTCDQALSAIQTLYQSTHEYNQKHPEAPIAFGSGLHFGEVLYGNIGSPARLDFTVMGLAVNLTSRLQSLNARTNQVCLVSERFAQLTTQATTAVGSFDLKGISEAQRVYAPELEIKE